MFLILLCLLLLLLLVRCSTHYYYYCCCVFPLAGPPSGGHYTCKGHDGPQPPPPLIILRQEITLVFFFVSNPPSSLLHGGPCLNLCKAALAGTGMCFASAGGKCHTGFQGGSAGLCFVPISWSRLTLGNLLCHVVTVGRPCRWQQSLPLKSGQCWGLLVRGDYHSFPCFVSKLS